MHALSDLRNFAGDDPPIRIAENAKAEILHVRQPQGTVDTVGPTRIRARRVSEVGAEPLSFRRRGLYRRIGTGRASSRVVDHFPRCEVLELVDQSRFRDEDVREMRKHRQKIGHVESECRIIRGEARERDALGRNRSHRLRQHLAAVMRDDEIRLVLVEKQARATVDVLEVIRSDGVS